MKGFKFGILLFTISMLLFVSLGAAPIWQNPPKEISTELVILGGDDAGLGAVWAAGEMGIETLLVLAHERDFGGDFTQFIPTDIAVSARCVGGINYVYDTFARRHTNQSSGSSTAGKDGRVAPPGPSIDFLYSLISRYENIKIIAGYLPQPHSGVLDAQKRVQQVSVISETGEVITIHCQYAIDGTPEGYGAKAFDLPLIFGREGMHADEDPTRNMEAFAGRRMFATRRENGPILSGMVPLLEQYCDRAPETEDNSMAASPVTPLKEYAPEGADVPDTAPWLLANPPEGYDPANFEYLKNEKRPGGNRNGRQVWRFSGNEPLKSLPEWYKLPDGTHYLRQDDVWKWKRYVEHQAFLFTVQSMYYYQNNTPQGKRFGFDKASFESNSATWKLSDFGTTSYGGDQYVGCRLYHRVLARLDVPDHLGGQLFFRREGRPYFHEKSWWVSDGIGVPLLEIDYHSILAKSVSSPPGAGPEGSAFTYCVPEASGLNFHSLPRKVIEPDYSIIDNYLSPGTPAVTFMAQSSLRAGSSMNHLGVAAAAMIALAKKNNVPVSQVNTLELQWLLVNQLNTAIVYFENAIAGTPQFPFEQMAGVLGIPPHNITDQWQPTYPIHTEAIELLNRYWEIKQPRFSFDADEWPLTREEFLKTMFSKEEQEKLVQPGYLADVPVHLNEIRQILTRYMIRNIVELPPYQFPRVWIYDSFNRAPGNIDYAETGSEWTNEGFEIYRGHATSNMTESTAYLLGEGTKEDFKLSVELCLEQKPDDMENGGIQQCGLVFDHQNNDVFGFLGITSDRGGLKFGVQRNENVLAERALDSDIASFVLTVTHKQGLLECRVNDQVIYHAKHQKSDMLTNVGLIHGPGNGRVHFQNFCLELI